jgi:PAS domain S-box-containing protein
MARGHGGARPGAFQALLASNTVGLGRIGPDGTLLEANERLLAALRVDRAALARGEVRIDADPALLVVRKFSGLAPGEAAVFCLERDGQEEARAASERMFRELAEVAPIGIFRTNERGEFVYVNERWQELSGLRGEEGLGTRWLRLIHPDDLAWVTEARKHFDEEIEGEYRVIVGGEVRFVRSRGRPLFDEQGRIAGRVGVVDDITERRLAERNLRESEEAFRALSEAAPIGIFRVSLQGEVVFANEQYHRMTGLVRGMPIMNQWMETIHPDDRPLIEELMRRARRDPTVKHDFECRLVVDGEVRWFRLHIRPVVGDDGQVLDRVGVVEDITAAKRAEAERERLLADAQAANRAKDHFLAVLSHELRTPLAAIRAGSDILRLSKAAEDPQLRRTIDAIDRNARLQARLVDDLLDLSRLVRGRIVLERTPLALSAVIGSAVLACRRDAARAGVGLEMDAGTEELWVDGDFDRLQQVVMNLLSNAIKFTPTGGWTRVSLARVPEGARVVVQDTGAGIEPGRLPTLFAMFQEGIIGARRETGLGIGLTLVKAFTELHGGRVRAESEGLGHGSRFIVELPTIAPPTAGAEVNEAAASRPHLRLLLVEDNEDARSLLHEALELLDYDVTDAGSGEAALDLLAHTRVDAILADIGLPGMSGYELARELRARPATRNVPAFAVTGFGRDDDVRRAHDAGFTGHFTKPIDLHVLDERVRASVPG